jgi:hypothetical protein
LKKGLAIYLSAQDQEPPRLELKTREGQGHVGNLRDFSEIGDKGVIKARDTQMPETPLNSLNPSIYERGSQELVFPSKSFFLTLTAINVKGGRHGTSRST